MKKAIYSSRSIISRFIASERTGRLGWCFISKKTTPCNYLTCERLIFRESVWGTDVEILAASDIFDADIYVANNFYRTQGSLNRVTRWSLLRAQDNSTGTLYIANYGHYIAPVINMLNSSTPTYGSGTTLDVVQLIEQQITTPFESAQRQGRPVACGDLCSRLFMQHNPVHGEPRLGNTTGNSISPVARDDVLFMR